MSVHVADGRSADASRYVTAMTASCATLAPLLGTYPAPAMTVTVTGVPWWSTAPSMTVELATARAVARQYWAAALDMHALPPWFVDGLVEYSARRIVEPVFQRTYVGDGYAMLELRYFGGLVPWFVRVRLMPDTGGEAIAAYRRDPHADVTAASPRDADALVGKTILTLNTVERWISRPVLDGALAEVVHAWRGRTPTLPQVFEAIASASGEDLSWLVDQTFEGTMTFDYAVASVSSSAVDGGYETTVVVERRGDGVFAGTSTPRVGRFESGRGIGLRVTFDDGQQVDDRWDGRDWRKAFVYRAPAPAVSAIIDPDHVVALDVDVTNNVVTRAPKATVAARRWSARWALWLQHVLLTYGFFV
jgi:hypothetical protein